MKKTGTIHICDNVATARLHNRQIDVCKIGDKYFLNFLTATEKPPTVTCVELRKNLYETRLTLTKEAADVLMKALVILK